MLVRRLIPLSLLLIGPFACGGGADGDADGDADGTGGMGSDDLVGLDLDAGGGPGSGTAGAPGGPYELPDGFTAGDKGGWLLGDEIVGGDGGGTSTGGSSSAGGNGSGGSAEDCGTEIIGIVRDFRRGDREGGHADFETFHGSREQTGLLENELSSARKPVFSGTGPSVDPQQMTTEDNFDQWYNNTPGVNRAYLTTFSFEPNGDLLTFQSTAFFPLDGEGWGNQDQTNNFGFTTEIHTEFVYRAGDTFSFTGDDDLWVFINNKLALDLGGLHPQVDGTIALDDLADELDIEVGEVYALDLFHAERHSGESNFRVDTTLEFTGCNIIIDDVVK